MKREHLEAEAYRAAPILQRMIELLGADGCKLTFGEALSAATKETGITVSQQIEEAILKSAFRVIAAGRIPGMPDS